MNNENDPILIGQVGDIELDSVEHFKYEEIDYAIYHLDSGYYATQGICICEENAHLSDGTIENEEIECPSCRQTFSIVSGDPISDPESSQLKIYEVTIKNKDLFLNL